MVTADENFVVAIDGSVSGSAPGAAGLVVQVPDSFEYVRASFVASTGRKRLRLQPALAGLFTPEPGHRVIALADSSAFARVQGDDIRVLLTLRAKETGTFSLKCVAAAQQESGVWRTGDGAPRDFNRIVASDKIVTLTVVEPERNGTSAVSFAGDREHLVLPDTGLFTFSREQDFSLELWLASTARDAAIVSTRGDDVLGAFPFELGIDERGSLALSTCDGSVLARTRSAAFIADGSWHHVAVVYTSSTRSFELYMDSRFVEALTAGSGEGVVPSAGVMVGGRPSRKKWFSGVIDEFRVWSIPRTQDEIIFYRNTALSGYEKNLYALFSFERAQNGRISSTAAVEGVEAVAYNKPKLVPSTAPLRVELISFSVIQEGADVTMSWDSYDESKVRAYQIEKRTEEGKYSVLLTFESSTAEGNHRSFRANDTWTEKSVVYYRLKKINLDGSIVLSDEVPIGAGEIMNFTLGDNAPNPFLSVTEIPYTLSETANVTLRVYDITGREVRELVSDRQKAGSYSVTFDGSDLPAGAYFYKLRTPAGAQTKKMFLGR